MSNPTTKYLVFDFDGTLADTWQATVYAHAVLNNKSEAETAEDLLNNRLVKPRYTKDRKYSEAEFQELMDFRKKEYELKASQKMTLFSGFIEEIKKLQDAKLAVVSTAYQPVLENLCNQTGLNFTHIFGFGPDFSKEARMQKIALDWHTELDEIYFITDTIRDVVEAKEFLNVEKIIGCSWGFHGFNRLLEVLPEKQIMKDFSDFSRIIT